MNNRKNTLDELLNLTTMTLATCGDNGMPHAAPVYFAADKNFRLYFFSDNNSQHGIDLTINSRAAAAIYRECVDWEEIHGLQLQGIVKVVTNPDNWNYAWNIFSSKFPFVIELKEIVKNNSFYVFKTKWIRLVDNRVHFGFKQEWTL